MKTKSMPLACLSILFLAFSNLTAQEGKISGYMFGDYFYEFSHPDPAIDTMNRNGFQFRRIYFTYDRELSESFAVRFRLEINSPNFGRNDQLVPYVKHAYLSWKNLIPEGKLYFGLSNTPTFLLSDEIWGYRSVEKTIMDLRGIASSADFGVALEGKFTSSGVLNYHLLLANGAGTRGETDANKRLYLSVPIKMQKAYFVVPYVDYESGNDGRGKNLLALFAGMQKPNFHGGLEVFQKINNEALPNNADRTEFGLSIFGAVKTSEKIKLLGRFDIFDPNTDLDDDGNTFIIAGLDFAPEKNVNLIPNIKIESYQQDGRNSNTVGALTLFFRF